MRVGLKTLKQIEEWYGSDDFEIGSGGNCSETYITLRFGYWREIDNEELSKVINKNVELEMEFYDDDCGWKYYYKIV